MMTKIWLISYIIINLVILSTHAYSPAVHYENFEGQNNALVDQNVWEEDANYYSKSSDKFEGKFGNYENAQDNVNIRPCRHILYPTYAGTGMERLEDPLHDEKFVSTIKDYIRLRRHPEIESKSSIQDLNSDKPPYIHQVKIRPDPNQYYSPNTKVQDYYDPNSQQILVPNYHQQVVPNQETQTQGQPHVYYDNSKQIILPNYQEQPPAYQEPQQVYQQPAIQETIRLVQESSPIYHQTVKTLQDYVSQPVGTSDPKAERQFYDTSKQIIITPTYQDQNEQQVVDTSRRQVWVPTYTQFYDTKAAPPGASQMTYETQQQNIPTFPNQILIPTNQVIEQPQIRPVQRFYVEPAKQYIQIPHQQPYYSQPIHRPVIVRSFNQEPADAHHVPTIVLRDQPIKLSDIVTEPYVKPTPQIEVKEITEKTLIAANEQESENNDEVVKVEPHLESFLNDQVLPETSSLDPTSNIYAPISEVVSEKVEEIAIKTPTSVKTVTQKSISVSDPELADPVVPKEIVNTANLDLLPSETQISGNIYQSVISQKPLAQNIESTTLQIPDPKLNPQDRIESLSLVSNGPVTDQSAIDLANFYQPTFDEKVGSYQIVDKPNLGKVLTTSAKAPDETIQQSPSITESIIQDAANVDDKPDVKYEEKSDEIVDILSIA